jgi:Flp pilus assembly protein TadG
VGSDRGGVTVELVLLTPVLLGFLAFMVLLGRIAEAGGQVEGAARDASRAASLERTTGLAADAAHRAAEANLAGQGITCGSLRVVLDTANWRPGGSVRADVRCAADLTGLGLAGVPGGKTLTGSSVSPLEQHRGQP